MRRRAFTLIELLIVIGIIAILIALVTLGVRHISKTGREAATRTTMNNLKNLIVERDITGGLAAVNGVFQPPTWPGPQHTPNQADAPGDVGLTGADRQPLITVAGSPPAPVANNTLGTTVLVMNVLNAVPNNRKMIAAMPTNTVKSFTSTPSAITAPIALDAWGNPIIYVPGGGLIGVCVTGAGPNGKVYRTVAAPDGRGFWASAGPDGAFGVMPGGNGVVGLPPPGPGPDADDIAVGDDNIYSFEN